MAVTPCDIPCQPCVMPVGGSGAAHLGINPLDPNNPFVNLSAEDPDADLFTAQKPLPPTVGEPPLGDYWYAAGCLGFCISTVSQADADLCAAAQAVECVSPQWPDPGVPPPNGGPPPPSPRTVYYNDLQSCAYTCPDGTPFSFTVLPGKFAAFNKATANAMAKAYACQRAAANRLCPGALTVTKACEGSSFNGSIGVSTTHLPVTFDITAGDLPPGLSPSQNFNRMFISGTPTTTGEYNFTVSITDSIGGQVSKNFTINIYGIVNDATLDEANVGIVYSLQLVPSSNLTGTLTYALLFGALPDGLTLDTSTGEISGTTTAEEDASFAISVSNGTTTCNKQFTLRSTTAGPCALFFKDIIWNPVNASGTSASGSTNENTATAQVASFVDGDFSQVIITGSISYTGPAAQCRMRIEYTDQVTNGGLASSDSVTQDGNEILTVVDSGTTSPTSGFINFSIDLADSPVASALVISLTLEAGTGPVNPGLQTTTYQFIFGDFP